MNYIKIKELINKDIKDSLFRVYNIVVEDIEVELPKEIINGHFSTNVALKNCKVFGTNPRNLAVNIIDNLELNSIFGKVEIAGPGFINFYLSEKYFRDLVIELKKSITIDSVEKPEKINVEFVSANPTGDLHLGHARGAAYGDAVSRLLKKVGHDVTSEYYINDAGSQMDKLGMSIKYFYELLCSIDSKLPEGGYGGSEIKEMAQMIFDEHGNSKLNESIEWFREFGYSRNLNEIKRVLGELNVSFDVWSSERFYHETGFVKKSLDVLEKTGDIYKKDDAIWLNTKKYGDDKDRVIEKSDGSHTYFTSDIAYHIDKYNRGFERLINVWGGDHHGYVKRVKCAMESLGHSDSIEILLIQMINIVRGDEVVKMSKRAGTSVTIKNMLKEIDADSMRYFFVMRSPDTQLDFDLELAQKQSSENPVFYIQYAHARICSLINTAKEKEIFISDNVSKLNDMEIEIINTLASYQLVVKEAANKRLPHILSNYLYELSAKYHQYYNAQKVFILNNDEINDKINIGISIKNVLKDGLDILGINAKDKM
ncbi:MAG: arginine--tRNA ligase [Mycoplasmatales bacterium]